LWRIKIFNTEYTHKAKSRLVLQLSNCRICHNGCWRLHATSAFSVRLRLTSLPVYTWRRTLLQCVNVGDCARLQASIHWVHMQSKASSSSSGSSSSSSTD